jgi:hypothetical protein
MLPLTRWARRLRGHRGGAFAREAQIVVGAFGKTDDSVGQTRLVRVEQGPLEAGAGTDCSSAQAANKPTSTVGEYEMPFNEPFFYQPSQPLILSSDNNP